MSALDHPYFKDTKAAQRHRGEEVKEDGSPANRLTALIISHVTKSGGAARRVNVQGRYKEGEVTQDVVGRTRLTKGQWIPSGMRKGYEDVDAIKPLQVNGYLVGVKVAIEIKIGKDDLSKEQKERRAEVLAAGGFYIVAREFEQFKADWDAIRF